MGMYVGTMDPTKMPGVTQVAPLSARISKAASPAIAPLNNNGAKSFKRIDAEEDPRVKNM